MSARRRLHIPAVSVAWYRQQLGVKSPIVSPSVLDQLAVSRPLLEPGVYVESPGCCEGLFPSNEI
ncbi:hypothetical protein C0Q70_15900 [Pomacea canaliculata]|uniref:Uncharacterized protein n=1 Tax=Pomacea canaliculata TaxID=400727 RepID=A0A2T7NNA2_POMCA|nr:hypothetical protein C0Q70_15900 [Pomacea canaliculata]